MTAYLFIYRGACYFVAHAKHTRAEADFQQCNVTLCEGFHKSLVENITIFFACMMIVANQPKTVWKIRSTFEILAELGMAATEVYLLLCYYEYTS